MKKTLLTACLAFTLTACKDEPPAPRAAVRTPPPARAVAAPVVRDTPAKAPSAPPVDPLALVHEDAQSVDHLARARELRETGDFAQALAECQAALLHTPESEDALLAVSRLAPMVGNTSLTVQAYQRLAALHPEDTVFLVRAARVLLGSAKADEAMKVGAEALARDAFNPEVHQVLGRAHLALGELTPAIERFQKVVELDPDHGHALNNLGFALLRANENGKAVEALTRAAELLPRVAYVQNNLGVALERVGRREDAEDAYALATSLSPRYIKARINSQRLAQVHVPDSQELETGGPEASQAASAPEEAPEDGSLDVSADE